MLIDRSIARIRAYAAHMKWSRNRLATEARIAESTIRGLGEPGWSPNTDTLRRLEAVIPDDFRMPDGGDPPEQASAA